MPLLTYEDRHKHGAQTRMQAGKHKTNLFFFHKRLSLKLAMQGTAIILVLVRLRQEDYCGFETSLEHMTRFCLIR